MTALELLGITDELIERLHAIATLARETNEEAFRKALNLYEAAIDMQNKGCRLAGLNADDEIITEISGVGSDDGAFREILVTTPDPEENRCRANTE